MAARMRAKSCSLSSSRPRRSWYPQFECSQVERADEWLIGASTASVAYETRRRQVVKSPSVRPLFRVEYLADRGEGLQRRACLRLLARRVVDQPVPGVHASQPAAFPVRSGRSGATPRLTCAADTTPSQCFTSPTPPRRRGGRDRAGGSLGTLCRGLAPRTGAAARHRTPTRTKEPPSSNGSTMCRKVNRALQGAARRPRIPLLGNDRVEHEPDLRPALWFQHACRARRKWAIEADPFSVGVPFGPRCHVRPTRKEVGRRSGRSSFGFRDLEHAPRWPRPPPRPLPPRAPPPAPARPPSWSVSGSNR